MQNAEYFENSVLKIGDRIKWIDYDEVVYEGQIELIQYKADAGPISVGPEPILEIPIWEREDYVLHLGNGFSIAGDLVKERLRPNLKVLK